MTEQSSSRLPMFGPPAQLPEWLLLWAAVFTCLSFLLPNHYSPWVAFQQEWCAAIALAPLMGWAIVRPPMRVPLLAWLALLMGMVAALQWFAGLVLFHGDAAMALLYWWGLGLATLAGCAVATRRPSATRAREEGDSLTPQKRYSLAAFAPIWTAVVLSCVVSLGVAVHQWLDLSLLGLYVIDLKPGSRPYGNLAQPNQLSTLFFIGLMGLAFLFEARRISAFVALLGAVVMCVGLTVTQSRSALLIVIWLLVAYFALRQRSGLRIAAWVPVAITGFFASLSLAWPTINQALLISDNALRAVDRTTAGQRAIYWRSMLDAIAERPLGGFGFQQVNMAQRATALDYPATHGFFESSHNLVLDLMGWVGVPLACLVILCVLMWFIRQWRALRDGPAWATFAALGVFGVHSMVEFPLYYAYFLLPAGLWVGALSGNLVKPLSSSELPPLVKFVWMGVAAVCAVLAVWVTDEYLAWEEDWRTARFQEMGYSNTPAPVNRSVVLLDQIGDVLWWSRYEVRPAMPARDLKRARRLAERESNAMVMFKYAKAVALNGQPEEAAHYLRLYQSLHPKPAYAQARRDWLKASETWPQLQSVSLPAAAGASN